MRELAKSAFTFPWALSMIGVQQIVNLVAPPDEGRVTGATAAIDAVTHAAERQLDGWLDQALEIGDMLQRRLAGMKMMRPPSLDSSGLMRMATDRRLAPLCRTLSDGALLPAARLDSLRMDPADRSAAVQEFANKTRVMHLVTQVHLQLRLDEADEEPLPRLIERAAALRVDPRLWAVEALGVHAGERAIADSGGADPQDVLTPESQADLPPWSLTMLHAGLGLSFARAILERLEPTSSRDMVRLSIMRFAGQCRRSSRRGYAGAAFESLGMAARLLHRNLVPLLDREIPLIDPELQDYFWHGAGRAMYFDPMNMLPSSNAPSSIIANLRHEAPHDLAYRNALSGIAWAMTLTNMRSPEVLELFLRHHGLLAARNDAFANGISSAIVIRYDTTPDDPHIMPFVTHTPPTKAAAEVWRSVVTAPCHAAITNTYRALQQTWALGHLFHYRPSPA
ncbi:MAG: hypothetical protein NTV05_06135 [Acidobacteria bacterium]|nr:hypothetical protein [Acidobacteriota bacterium]